MRQGRLDEGEPVHVGKDQLLAQNERRTGIDLELISEERRAGLHNRLHIGQVVHAHSQWLEEIRQHHRHRIPFDKRFAGQGEV